MREFTVADGMSRSVFESKYSRRKPDGQMQTYAERIGEVIDGNFALDPRWESPPKALVREYERTRELAIAGVMPTSGRHLQHGDLDQPNKVMELHTNCFGQETKILTLEYGPAQIGALVGKVVTVRAKDGTWREAKVSCHGVQPLTKVEFGPKTGQGTTYPLSVVVTPDHRWFLEDGSTTMELKVGDVLAVPPCNVEETFEAIQHGLVFGDGGLHKRRNSPERILSQGRTPVTLRLCGEKKKYLDYFMGYTVTYPPSAQGDPVIYVGMKEFWKDLPFALDPDYIAGFIKGWWMADGSKTYSRPGIEITTSNIQAVEWLKDYAAYAGWRLTGISIKERKDDDGSYPTELSALYCVRMSRETPVKVRSIIQLEENDVFCVEEPVTQGFVLANGILTGNCATALFSFMLFRLLLQGSGVGRDYTSAVCRVDWSLMPDVRLVMDESHPDFKWDMFRGVMEPLRDARHKYPSESEQVRWFVVGDSREGWSKIIEILETAAWQCKHANKLFIFDFSQVRAAGMPIRGLQNRPASGPIPLMNAIAQVASIKAAGMPTWKQALFIDHYIAACVQFGGARRSARMSVKHWRDRDIIDFIDVKRGGFLWSSNNSVLVDQEFWADARKPQPSHARRVFEAIAAASYWDGTGEPGFINVDLMNTDMTGAEEITSLNYINKEVYPDLHPRTDDMIDNVLIHVRKLQYPFLTNPCGEISLSTWGGYCVEGSTRILHRYGYDKISDLVGKRIEIFNGQEWSEVVPFQTGIGHKLLRVTLSDGSYLDCTPYHEFSTRNNRLSKVWSRKQADQLLKGDILPTFRVPESIAGESEPEAYTYGAFLGDGGIESRALEGKGFRYTITLYEGKHHLPVTGTRGSIQKNTGIDVTVSHLNKEYMHSLKEPELPDWVFQLDHQGTSEFIRGWLDTDGVYHEGVGGVSISTAEEGRARGLQLLLRRIGISYASVRQAAKIGDLTNFGARKKPLWVVYVPASEAALLNSHRVRTDYEIDLDHVVKQPRVTSVIELSGLHDTFCFTEPKRGMGVFGNFLTYQCVIGDVCLAKCETIQEAIDAVRLMAKFLVRVNRMKAVYAAEVQRTNRIGVALTGVHEFAWTKFGCTFWDLIAYHTDVFGPAVLTPPHAYKAHEFWQFIGILRHAAEAGASEISLDLGMPVPHTVTTIKPSGTISKVMSCTEGVHLPALKFYLRWVQYKYNDPDLQLLRERGYPTKDVSHRYAEYWVVGFPTKQPIVDLMGAANVVCADETSPAQNYQWLQLLEHFWLGESKRNNNISYTLKYDPDTVSYLEFMDLTLKYQPDVRCCSVMPQSDWRKSEQIYSYVPEQPLTEAEYLEMMSKIRAVTHEGYNAEDLECAGGACPIELDQLTLTAEGNVK